METTDLYLQGMLSFHIAITSIALFLLAPVAILATKGGRWHIRAGKYLYWSVIAGSISGVLLLFDANFIDRWLPTEGAAFERSIGPWLAASPTLMKDLFFFYAAVAGLVFVISGARVWTRVGAAAGDRVGCDGWDWLMSLSMAALAIFWIVIGAVYVERGGLHGDRLLMSSLILLGFSLVDVWTYRARPSPTKFPWFALHAAKMTTVVVFLLLAYQFHLQDLLPGPLKNPYIAVGLFVALVAVFFALDRRRPPEQT